MKITNLFFYFVITCFFILASCKKEGCTDPLATNYDENAKKDDGSCMYEHDSIPEEEKFASCELCHTSYAHLQEVFSPDTAGAAGGG